MMGVKLCAPVHLCTCALCALLALLALLVGLTPLLQCAKQAGKTVMRFISATIMTLVEGGRAVFNSMERVRLDKIKKKKSIIIMQGLRTVLENGRALVLSMGNYGDDSEDEEQQQVGVY